MQLREACFNGMNNDAATTFEGFICPACVVDFPSAGKLQDHWLKFHSRGVNGEGDAFRPEVQTESAVIQKNNHAFKSRLFRIPEMCSLCGRPIKTQGYMCQGCIYCCHRECLPMVTPGCPSRSLTPGSSSGKMLRGDGGTLKLGDGKINSAPSSPKSLVSHLRRHISKNRVRHVDEEFDLDLTYITERIIAMSFPGTGLETSYRNSLRDVAKMLQSKHQDKYMVFNLSERRYDISKLNHQVLDFGWPDHLAPPFERLCSIIKSIDSWLKSDRQHVVVVHCKGGKGRTGVVISAYMQFSKVCPSPQAALDWFAMKRFYDDRLGGVTQPSQRRYVHYFSDYLKGGINLNADPIFLHHLIIHGIPSFDGKGGCKPFLRVYDGLKLIYTSGVFQVTSEMERVCITIEGGLILHGDILIKCYHKNTLSSGRDIIFRCQFHTGAIVDYGLVLDKTELDDACRDKRFPDDVKVEFVFSATGSSVSEIKDNQRLQSIIQHSLQPVENPDTVLFPSRDSMADGWSLLKRGNDGGAAQEPDHRTTRDTNSSTFGRGRSELDTGRRRPSCPVTSLSHVAGPIDGNPYAQIDKDFRTKLRSFSLDYSARSRGAEPAFAQDPSLNFRNAYPNEGACVTLNNGRHFRYPEMTSQASLENDRDYSQQIHSIDRMLKELGNCTEMLDSTLQRSKSNRAGHVGNGWQGEVAAPTQGEPQPCVSERVQFYNKQGFPMGTPMKRAGSFDEGDMKIYQQAALNRARLGRSQSAGQVELSEELAYRRPVYSAQRTPSPGGTPGRGGQSPSDVAAGSLKNYDGRTAHTLPIGMSPAAHSYSGRSGSPSQQRNGAVNQQWSAHAQQRSASPSQRAFGSPNQQRSGSPNQQRSASPNQRTFGSPNQQRVASTNLQRSGSPNQQRSPSPNQRAFGSPNQQRSASPSQQWSSHQPNYHSSNAEVGPTNQRTIGSSNQQLPPSVNQPVVLSLQMGQRSQMPNSITTVAQIHHPRATSPSSEAGLRTPSPGGSSGGRRSPSTPSGLPGSGPKVVMLSERSSTPESGVCEAPKVYTGAPEPPLSPTLYASTQTTPKLFMAATHMQTDGPRDAFSGRDVFHPASSWQGAKEHSIPTGPENGKPALDPTNMKDNLGDSGPPGQERIAENVPDERPVEGTVASKIAFLTDMYKTEQGPGHYLPCRGPVMPLVGLSRVSPTDVSKEIAEYNAKALAPGELSHCADTLYVTGAVPKRIVDRTPGGAVVGEPCTFILDEFEQRVLARGRADPGELSPSNSMDINSIDAEVGGSADADDVSALSSDGHADSAFGGSSSVSTPVAGHSSNRFIPVVSAAARDGGDRSISPTSSPRSSLDELARSAQEAREDEESGYARLEDVRPPPKKDAVLDAQRQTHSEQAPQDSHFRYGTPYDELEDVRPPPRMDDVLDVQRSTPHSEQAPQESPYRPGSNISSGTQNTLRGSHSETPTIFDSRENVQNEGKTELEAIDVILSEMTELSLKEPPPASPVPSNKDAALSSTGSPPSYRSTSSSDGYDKHRNKSHPFSDMGYGSTNSVSSDSSSGDNVFVESPTKIPGVSFVKDTSCYWYKPNITRDQAINFLKNAGPGTFVIRDSQSFPGAFGLAVKVMVPPAHAIKKDMSQEDIKAELVRHFLIESTKKGCRLKGCPEEPIFGSLSAFVYQHTITPLALPLTLSLPKEDLISNGLSSNQKENESSFAKGSAGSLVFLGSAGVEMLTGPSAVQKTVETLFKQDLDSNSFTTVGFKVSPQGFTVTDTCRKMFFRRHFALSSIQYCGIDPLDKRWDLKSSSDYGQKSRAFGIVLRTTGGVHNECHIFAECTKEWTSNILVNVINRYMSHKSL